MQAAPFLAQRLLAPRVEEDMPKMDFTTTVFDNESGSIAALSSRATQMTITGLEQERA